MEVFVLAPQGSDPDPAAACNRIMKQSLMETHSDIRIIHEGAHQPADFDREDALSRMSELNLMGGYGFVTELRPAVTVHRLTVEYAELLRDESGAPARGKPVNSTTDFFSLHRGNLLLQLNMKTLSKNYRALARTFETVAASAQLGE